jgi:hypothetical protein
VRWVRSLPSRLGPGFVSTPLQLQTTPRFLARSHEGWGPSPSGLPVGPERSVAGGGQLV